MKHTFEYNYSHMHKEEKKSFVHRVIENNFASACWKPSVGMQAYREAQSIAMRNGKWSKIICYANGVHISSLRSPGWGLSTGNTETSQRLQRWWKWLRPSR
jgi:hypothetical protein